jgi:hypothetical protein
MGFPFKLGEQRPMPGALRFAAQPRGQHGRGEIVDNRSKFLVNNNIVEPHFPASRVDPADDSTFVTTHQSLLMRGNGKPAGGR